MGGKAEEEEEEEFGVCNCPQSHCPQLCGEMVYSLCGQRQNEEISNILFFAESKELVC